MLEIILQFIIHYYLCFFFLFFFFLKKYSNILYRDQRIEIFRDLTNKFSNYQENELISHSKVQSHVPHHLRNIHPSVGSRQIH